MRTRTMDPARACRIVVVTALAAVAGCHAHKVEQSSNPALRPIVTPAGGTSVDADRAMLARFVGDWSFEGHASAADGEAAKATGRAAGVIENEHFVLIDLRVESGRFGARGERKGGSLLLASEPGIGLTMTGWGGSSPSIVRLVGRAEGSGSRFSFDEVKSSGARRVNLSFEFEADDRFVATIRDATNSSVLGSYTFTRVIR